MSSFKDLIKQISDEPDVMTQDPETYSNFDCDVDFLPLPDDIANLILMHRNAHFGGKFSIMLDYYQNEGIGCSNEFDMTSIRKLADIENQIGQDIAPARLSEIEQEQVINVLKLYQGLRKLHSCSQNKTSTPTLLAELILTEEPVPQREIEALSKEEKALPYLLDILKSEEFLDPLFPGYGKTPSHVATILGKMQAEKAIVPLFESMKAEYFQHEEAVLSALRNIGQSAFDFLMQVLKNEPFNNDNEKAAICLTHFGENEKLALLALELLQNAGVLNLPNLVVHLILCCLGLQNKKDISKFQALEKQLPNMYGPDFKYVLSKLKKKLS